MKRVIDEKMLKALYPPMETAFEAQMRQTLRSLPVERRHRGARRKPAAVLVAAAVLALLAATALAIAAARHWLARRALRAIGGQTGDVLGAIQQAGEAAGLVALTLFI